MLLSSPPQSSAPCAWTADSPDILKSTVQREPAAEVRVPRLSGQGRLAGMDVIGQLLPPLGSHGIEVLPFKIPDSAQFSSPRTDGGQLGEDLSSPLNLEQTRLLCGLFDAEPSGVVIVERGRLPSLLGVELPEGHHPTSRCDASDRQLWVETPILNHLRLFQMRGEYVVPRRHVPLVAVDASLKPEKTVEVLRCLLVNASRCKARKDEGASAEQQSSPLRVAIGGATFHGEAGDVAAILHALRCAKRAAEASQALSEEQVNEAMQKHFKHQQAHGRTDVHPDECLFAATARVIGVVKRSADLPRSSQATSSAPSLPIRAGNPTLSRTVAPIEPAKPAKPAELIALHACCGAVARCFAKSYPLGWGGSFRRAVTPEAFGKYPHGAAKAIQKVMDLLKRDLDNRSLEWLRVAHGADGEFPKTSPLLSECFAKALREHHAQLDSTAQHAWRRHAIHEELGNAISANEGLLRDEREREQWPIALVTVEMLKQLRAVGQA